jgi:hypothetical protein
MVIVILFIYSSFFTVKDHTDLFVATHSPPLYLRLEPKLNPIIDKSPTKPLVNRQNFCIVVSQCTFPNLNVFPKAVDRP